VTESVWERAFGDRLVNLSPGLRTYFSLPPEGMTGHGSGVYEVAGSRLRWLWPALAFLAWRRILFPEFGHNVPFTVVNTPTPEGTLRAVRTFEFSGRTRTMVDEMRIVDGHLHDFLGRRGGLEARLAATVHDGMLRLTTERLWLHLGAVRVPLPNVARIALTERTLDGGQHVDVSLRTPLVGEWFVYRGAFTYELR
jgi:hypothetical protein